jgi:SAM-dependent methyltransferase
MTQTVHSTPTAQAIQPVSRQTDFDQVADEYDESLPAHVVEYYLQKRVAFIRRHIPPGPTLDVGCGTGVLTARLADLGYQMHGVDPSRGMLAHLHQSRPDIPAIVGDGTALPFPDGAFALTYCIAVMHHVAEKDAVRQTLLEMARVTRPGGRVLVWDHNPLNPYWRFLMRRVPQDTGAERLIPTDELLSGLRAGGAEPLVVTRSGFVPDLVPPPLLRPMVAVERVVEATAGLNLLCAHNVVLAAKSVVQPRPALK